MTLEASHLKDNSIDLSVNAGIIRRKADDSRPIVIDKWTSDT